MSKSIEDFQALLSNDNVTEPDCQSFLEENSEYIYTPFLLNHWIHFGAIITKFPLDTSLETDFAYLTKSSNFWHLVLVEIEHPNKRLFRDNNGKIIPTAELTAAIAQVHSWQDFIRRNGNEVIRRLDAIRKPLERNPVYFKYLLVVGRSKEKSNNQGMIDRLASLGSDDFLICTYDSLISAYREDPRPQKKNIIRLTRDRYEIKYPHRDLGSMLSYMMPSELIITQDQKEVLLKDGYQLKEWEQGKPLRFNGKRVVINKV